MEEKNNIWCMNLKDNRNEQERNKDSELKFTLCQRGKKIAIGWPIDEPVNSWDAYKEIADKKYKDDKGYAAARNAFEKVQYGDLVWTKNPKTGEYYLVEITDENETPSICSKLSEKDIVAYRGCEFFPIEPQSVTGPLCKTKLRAVRAIEKMGDKKRGDTIKATIELFNKLKGAQNEKN